MTRRRRSLAGALALVGGGAIALTAVVAVFADGGTLDVEVADRTEYASAFTTPDNALVEYIGDQNETFGSSGSGVFDSFVRLQADPEEEGFNTDAKPELDTKSGAFTHSILVSDIPVIGIGGVPHWELFADINDSDNTPKITLNELEIYFTDDPDLVGYPFTGTAVKKYDFDGEIRINDVNQGSGRGDLRYSIPLTDITIPPECGYKNPACDTYFVLYSQWGAESGEYTSDGGFEEWKVKEYPYVVVSKTATPSFTRTHTWTIDKSVTPTSHGLFDGQSGSSTYTIVLDKTTVDSAWAVTGNIQVTNPAPMVATLTSLTDSLAIDGAATVDCGGATTVPASSSLDCTYSKTLAGAATQLNTATAVAYGVTYTGTASVDFTGVSPTVVGYDAVNVDDTNNAGDGGPFSDDTSYTYTRTFDCADITYTNGVGSLNYPNTATITETGASDNAAVLVTCYRLSVSKTAATTYDRDYTWTIDKSADTSEVTLDQGETTSVGYSVTVTASAPNDSNFAVAGSITISNPAPMPATVDTLIDDISGLAGDPTPSCPSSTVPAYDSLVCTYSSSLPNADARTNTATATAYGVSYPSNAAPITFGEPTNVIDECVTVTDSLQGVLGTACANESPKTWTYNRTVGPYATCGDFNVRNTASFVTNDTGATGSDSWNVLVHVIGCGNLFHTGTTCEQYYMGAPPIGLAGQGIEAVEYSVKSSLIKQVNPGVFFYYNDVTATGGSITIDVNQIPPTGYNFPMAIHQGQVLVYDENCSTYSNFSFTSGNGDVHLTINGTTAGHDYIFSVKYTPANLVGLAPPATSPVTYDWQTEFNGISGQDSLDFVNKSGASSTSTLSTTSSAATLTPTTTADTTSDDATEPATVETSHGRSADHPLPQGNGNGNGNGNGKDKAQQQ